MCVKMRRRLLLGLHPQTEAALEAPHLPEPGGQPPAGLDNAVREARGYFTNMMKKRGVKARWGTGTDELRLPNYDDEHAEQLHSGSKHESVPAKALRAFADKKVDRSLGKVLQRVRERIRENVPKVPKVPKVITTVATGAVITCVTAGCGGQLAVAGAVQSWSGWFGPVCTQSVNLWLQRGFTVTSEMTATCADNNLNSFAT